MFKDRSGRKAVVVISDGIDAGSMIKLDKAIESAQRIGLIAYTIIHIDTDFYHSTGKKLGLGPGLLERILEFGTRQLKKMSLETGGAYYEAVPPAQDMETIFALIDDELRSQYNIGYAPTKDLSISGYRRIALTCLRNGVSIQARKGYYPDAI